MFDKIEVIFYISDEDKEKIKKIDSLLSNLKLSNNAKAKNLKTKSRVRSIYSSLAIEDNSLSLESIQDINDGKLVFGKKDEVQEVKNAIELYKNINKYNFKSEKDFLKAHTLLMKYFEDDNGGYRTHGEAVKKDDQIIFKAPDSILVPSLMKSLFEYINSADSHPLILAALFHYYLVYIHPFTDGNGRIARFWSTLILISYDKNFEYLPLEEEIYLNQEKYYLAISNSHNNGNANLFISFFLDITLNCVKKVTKNFS